MGVKGEIVAEFELRTSAANFHNQCRHKPRHISNFSDHIQDCELLEGAFGQHGVILRWHYTLPDGKVCKAKERVEFNEQTDEVSWIVLEGDLADDYKNFVIKLRPIARRGQSDLIRWTLQYEKLRDNVPHPFQLLGMLLNIAEHIEAEHLKTG